MKASSGWWSVWSETFTGRQGRRTLPKTSWFWPWAENVLTTRSVFGLLLTLFQFHEGSGSSKFCCWLNLRSWPEPWLLGHICPVPLYLVKIQHLIKCLDPWRSKSLQVTFLSFSWVLFRDGFVLMGHIMLVLPVNDQTFREDGSQLVLNFL